MTIVTNWYTMDGKEGVDLNNVQTSITITTDPSVPGPRAKLGDRVQGNNGSEWMFVIAGVTVTAFNLVAITPGFSAQALTSAIVVSNAYTYGVAEFQPFQGASVGAASGGVANTGDYFWALIKANAGIRINATGTMRPGADLYLSAAGTAGFVAGSSSVQAISGGGRLNGLMFITSGTIEATSNVPGNINSEFGMFGYLMPAAQINAITV
jgi:hypothetical protein